MNHTGGLYYGLGATVRGIPQEDIRPDVEFVSVENAEGQREFSVANENRGLRFEGTGAVSVSFDPTTHAVKINAVPVGGTVYNYYYSYPTNNYYSYPTNNYYTTTVSAGAGLYANLSGTVWNIGIQDGGVSLSKLKMGSYDLNLGPRAGEGHSLLFFFPTFWGGKYVIYRLSDFGTKAETGGWSIYNYTDEWRYLRLQGITNSTPGFFVAYSPENGQINVVAKGDISMDNAISFGDVFYDIQNHPQREEILSNPEEFIFDLEKGTVRRVVS